MYTYILGSCKKKILNLCSIQSSSTSHQISINKTLLIHTMVYLKLSNYIYPFTKMHFAIWSFMGASLPYSLLLYLHFYSYMYTCIQIFLIAKMLHTCTTLLVIVQIVQTLVHTSSLMSFHFHSSTAHWSSSRRREPKWFAAVLPNQFAQHFPI